MRQKPSHANHRSLIIGAFLFLVVFSMVPIGEAVNSNYELNLKWFTPSKITRVINDNFILAISANLTLNTWLDESGNGNNGIIYGAKVNSPWESGKGWALCFDGIDDTIECSDNERLNASEGITVEVWVKPAQNKIHATIVAKESYPKTLGWMLHQMAGKDWYFRIYNGTTFNAISLANSVSIGKWQHVVATYDNQYLRLYKNGAQIATPIACNWSIARANEPLVVGARSTVGQYFNGSIAEIRIYNRALNETKIKYSYENNSPANTSGLALNLTFKNWSWILERSENGNDFSEVRKQSFDNLTIDWSEKEAGTYNFRGVFLGDDYYKDKGIYYTLPCSVNIVGTDSGLFFDPAGLIALILAFSVTIFLCYRYLRIKKIDVLFWQMDLIYLTAAGLGCQFLPISDIVRLLLSLPFFLIVPTRIGGFILSFSSRNRSSVLKESILGFVVYWCLGVISIFFLALSLQSLRLFNSYGFTLLVLCIFFYTKVKSGENEKPSLMNILRRFNSDLGDYRLFFVSLAIGVLPILLIYPHWPFPLKWASDAFLTNMLTMQITEDHLIDLFSSGIHQPLMPVLFSIPSLFFNVYPLHFSWGIPLLLYPVFSLTTYYFSYKLSNNEFLSLFSAAIATGACGAGMAVHLYLAHQRDFVTLLFPFITLITLKKISINESISPYNKRSIIQLVAFLLLSYSSLEVSLAPSENRLPSIFLSAVYVLFLFIYYLNIFKPVLVRILKYFSVVILSLFVIYFLRFFMLAPVYGNIQSFSFFWTVLGVGSAILLIASLLYGIKLNTPFSYEGEFLIISLCALLFHQQLSIMMVVILITATVIFHYIENRLPTIAVWLFAIFIVSIIVLEKFGVITIISTLSQFVSVGIPDSIFKFSFYENYRLLKLTFTEPILILSLFGILFSSFYRRSKETFMLFIGCCFLLFFFTPVSDSYRTIIFLVPIVAYFAANTFLTWNNLLPTKTIILNFKKMSTKITKSQVFFVILFITYLPTIVQPYTSFIDRIMSDSHPFYTFDYYDYETVQWIRSYTPKDVLIISDPFTLRTMCRLSNRKLTITSKMIYDEKGHTHTIDSDVLFVSTIKTILTTDSITVARDKLSELRSIYVQFKPLNEKLGKTSTIDDSTPILIVLNGRTSQWIRSDFSDVVYVYNFEFLPCYDKFFNANVFELLFEKDENIFVFKMRDDPK